MNYNPVVLSDGTHFYDELAQNYNTHVVGLFILAPSGAGKTHYCNNQDQPDWIDGDELWVNSGAHPDTDWWNHGIDAINYVDKRSDLITLEAKRQGFWIMGASNYWLKPDAIVIPKWNTLKKYIKRREESNYDGGATSDKLDQVKTHIEAIDKWHVESNVPKFTSIDEATQELSKSL